MSLERFLPISPQDVNWVSLAGLYSRDEGRNRFSENFNLLSCQWFRQAGGCGDIDDALFVSLAWCEIEIVVESQIKLTKPCDVRDTRGAWL